jgi:hypothetical protein
MAQIALSIVIILAVVFGVAIQFITTDGNYDPQKKRLTKRGKLLIICGIILVVLQGISIGISNHLVHQQDKRSLFVQDSFAKLNDKNQGRLYLKLRLQNDSTSKNQIKTFTDELIKFGLKNDTDQQKIIKGIGAEPSLVIASGRDSLSDTTHFLILFFLAQNAPCTGFNVNCHSAYIDKNWNFIFQSTFPPLAYGNQLSPTLGLDIPLHPINERNKAVLLWIEGNYTNISGTKTFPVSSVYEFKFSDKKLSSPGQELSSQAINFFKESERK